MAPWKPKPMTKYAIKNEAKMIRAAKSIANHHIDSEYERSVGQEKKDKASFLDSEYQYKHTFNDNTLDLVKIDYFYTMMLLKKNVMRATGAKMLQLMSQQLGTSANAAKVYKKKAQRAKLQSKKDMFIKAAHTFDEDEKKAQALVEMWGKNYKIDEIDLDPRWNI